MLAHHFHRALTHTVAEPIQLSTPLHEFEIKQVEEWMREGWHGEGLPCCVHAKGKLKLILEEKPVTVVVCWGLAVEI